MKDETEFAIIGGGLVGASIAYGLAHKGRAVTLLDRSDLAGGASAANFGQLWVQGKGAKSHTYRNLTIASSRAWAQFAANLFDETSVNTFLEQKGGLQLCLGQDNQLQRAHLCEAFNNGLAQNDPARMVMLDRDATAGLLGRVTLGPAVTGASFCALDGHVNPLLLWKSLYQATLKLGGKLHCSAGIQKILDRPGQGYLIQGEEFALACRHVIIAAGNSSPSFSRWFGRDIPVVPVRGQILVTERLAPFLALPTSTIRQTDNGSILIGSTHEHVGYDVGTTIAAAETMATKAIETFPQLARADLVRQWSGLRVMTPDGFPIYFTSRINPGITLAICHSGVGLSAFHAADFVDALITGEINSRFPEFSLERFDV